MLHTRLAPGFTFTTERLEQLKSVVPEAFADDKINWEALREALGSRLEPDETGAEHFGLFWPGKREARRLAALPSRGALLPVLGTGVDEGKSRNLLIEGDNLEALKLLQKAYAGRVKMIYIDPPYNTGSDFVYNDDFSDPIGDYLRNTGKADGHGALTTSPRADGRFHSNWLSMMYPRLRLARTLLTTDGVIVVSIDDNEAPNLRLLMAEVFGEENFIAQVVWQRSKRGDAKLVAVMHEYLVYYAREKAAILAKGGWRRKKPGVDEVLQRYTELRTQLGDDHSKIREAIRNWYKSLPKDDPRRAHGHYNWSDSRGLYFAADFAGPDDGRKSRPRYDILHPVTGKPCAKPSTGWRWEKDRTDTALVEDPPRIHFGLDETTIPCRKSYLAEIDSEPSPSVFYRDGRSATLEVEALVGEGVFPFPKNAEVVRNIVELCSGDHDLVLDFFAGSGTTAHAVAMSNRETGASRRWIMVQLPEPLPDGNAARKRGLVTLSDVARERVMKAFALLKKEAKPKPNEDLEFRVLKLVRSHFKAWEDYTGDDPDQLQTLFDEAQDPLVKGWTPEGLLTEVMLLEGFPLDSAVRDLPVEKGNRVVVVTSDHCGHRLLACLDKKLKEATLDGLAFEDQDVFVCLDNALTDLAKQRLADRCTLKTI
jgi:adenine-specific DNA-methyltransferase